MSAARKALAAAARELEVPRGRYPDPTDPGRVTTQPKPLDLAVTALALRGALELLATDLVEQARTVDGVTWEQVGEQFGTSMQSAHARFRRRS
ncbi:MAG: hypothetical protein R2755_26495 [Acidimicrobiales bacterium]